MELPNIGKQAIVVASLGRSGSTYIYDSLRNHLTYSNFRFFPHWRGAGVKSGGIYKTHDFPPASTKKFRYPVKTLFLFSNPYNIIVSTLSQTLPWFGIHSLHLSATTTNMRAMITEDIMRLEEHFDKWMKPQTVELMTIRYEVIPYYFKEINEFLELNIGWEKFFERKSNFLKHPNKTEIMSTYKNLYNKIAAAPDIKVWPKIGD